MPNDNCLNVENCLDCEKCTSCAECERCFACSDCDSCLDCERCRSCKLRQVSTGQPSTNATAVKKRTANDPNQVLD